MSDDDSFTGNECPMVECGGGAAFPPLQDTARAKIDALFELLRQPGGSPGTGTSADEMSQASHAYRLLHHHAKGGLGDVWLALDEGVERNVALKEIQPQFAGHVGSRSRFLREAKLTGQLEHPGIVPVYGIGQRTDGRPFYAMRFIQGETLQRAIERFHSPARTDEATASSQLAFRRLLDQFVQVCNAVAYAHSRGVIHRDLKPDNIMLGEFGETLVVDWGLAKSVLGPDRDCRLEACTSMTADVLPTRLGATVGTPAFMSPEQASGSNDELGPASDVYSLGATLYCILVGQRPFLGTDLETVLQKVRTGDFPRPKHVNHGVPASLEAVCLKAMALPPSDRYATVGGLADDIQHWLADEPVSAYRDALTTRVSRWGRRHRAIVASASALVLTSAFALVVNNHMLRAEQRRTEERRLEAVEAEKRAVVSQHMAEANERRALENGESAESNRVLAEQRAAEATERFGIAVDALTLIINGVQDELESRPVDIEFRRSLLQVTQESLDRLMAGARSSEQANAALLWCHLKTGDVQKALGHFDRAEAEFAAAEKLATRTIADDPSNTTVERQLVVCRERLGNLALNRRRFREALELHTQNLASRRKRLAAEPRDLNAQRELGFSYLALGQTYMGLGDLNLAAENFNKGLDAHKAIAAERPFLWFVQRDLVLAHEGLADLEHQLRHTNEAKSHLSAAEEIAESALKLDPANQSLKRDLYLAFQRHGNICLESGELETAKGLFQRGFDISRDLAASDPQNAQYQWDFATTNHNMAQVLEGLGNIAGAVEYFTAEVGILEKFDDRIPIDDHNRRVDLATANNMLASALQRTGDIASARRHYKRALGVVSSLPDQERRDVRLLHGTVAGNFGFCEMQANEYAVAAEWFRKAIHERAALPALSKEEDAQVTKSVEIYRKQLELCELTTRAIDDIDFALAQRSELIPGLLGSRILVLARRGDHQRAAQSAEKLAELGTKDLTQYYNAACGLALCVGAVAAGKSQEELGGADTAVQDGYAARALELLKSADAAGLFKNQGYVASLKQNPQLAALRSRQEFREFVAQFD